MLDDLAAVGQSVVVRVGVGRIGAVLVDLVAVVQAVAVAVGLEWRGAGLVLGQIGQAVFVEVEEGVDGIVRVQTVLALPRIRHAITVGVAFDVDGDQLALTGRDVQGATVVQRQVAGRAMAPDDLQRVAVKHVGARIVSNDDRVSGHDHGATEALVVLPAPQQGAIDLTAGIERGIADGVDDAIGHGRLAMKPSAQLPANCPSVEIEAEQPSTVDGQDVILRADDGGSVHAPAAPGEVGIGNLE